jgi:hypothetical protein
MSRQVPFRGMFDRGCVMVKFDWLSVGLKLIGFYFGVTGLASLCAILFFQIFPPPSATLQASSLLIEVSQPAIYLLAGFFFVIRTRSCLVFCGEIEPKTSP